MVISPENILLVGAILLFLSVLVGKTGAKFGVPALLLFLGVGMLAGSDGFGIYFDSPQIAQFIGTVALCIILFSGGMDTHYREIKPIHHIHIQAPHILPSVCPAFALHWSSLLLPF